jgi:hypothetical protein
MAITLQSVALASAGNGVGLAVTMGRAGTATDPILVTKSLIAGPGITIAAGDSGIDVIIGATGLPGLTSLITGHVHWVAGGSAPRLPIFTAAYPLIVTAILGRVEQSSTTPGQLLLVKVPSGVAISNGLPLSTAPFNVDGTLYVNQILPLIPDITTLSLAAGDSIGVIVSGIWTNCSGGITVHLAPGLSF